MHECYKHEASGAVLPREIAQPNVTTFKECFEDWKPYELMKHPSPPHAFAPRYVTGQNIAGNLFKDGREILVEGKRPTQKHRDENMPVGPFCSFSAREFENNRYFDVRCADWVLSRIKERTIVIGDDRMSFEVIDHGNGWSLVVAKHSVICGSVWLAYIKTESVP